MSGPWEKYASVDDSGGRPWEKYGDAPTKAAQEKQPLLETLRSGLATAPINMYLGAKQMFGGLDSIEQNILAQNKAAEKAAPVTSFMSNVLTAVPAMMIPGANTLAGAGIAGAGQALLQPVDGEQTLGNIAKGKAINTAIGGGLGVAGQAAGNRVAKYIGDTRTAAATQAALKAPRDAALAEGRAVGYVVPNSEVAPTFLGNKLESIGGKAALRQEATLRNQDVTNKLARQALKLADDQPITPGAVDRIRTKAGKVYEAVSDLSPQAAKDVESLKAARAESSGWYAAYNVSKRPDHLAKAKAADAEAKMLESWIDWHAVSAGKQDLLPQLVNARKEIAQAYTVERALNKTTGDVDARVLGRLYDKQKPLTDGLDTIGRFNQAFPKFTSPGAMTQVPGVNYLDAASIPTLGMMGALAAGHPAGALAGGLPLARGPARSLELAKFMQSTPKYGPGLLGRGMLELGAVAPSLLMRSAVPAGLLSAE